MTQQRPRPPYSQIVAAALAEPATWPQWFGTSPDGKRVSLFVAAGGPRAWAWARHEIEHRLVLMAPQERDPCEYSWRLCAEHAPAIIFSFDATVEHMERCAIALLRDGAERTLVQFPNGIVRYIKQGASAA